MHKGTFFLTISSFVFVFSAYLINIFLGRFLGPVGYGDYGIAIALMTAINIVQVSGIPQSVSKYIAQDEKKSDAIFKSGLHLQVLTTLIITVLFFFLSKHIAELLKDPGLTPYLQISSLIFPAYGIFALYNGYYNGLHYFKKQAILNITYSSFKSTAVIGLALVFHVYGALLGFVLAPIFALLLGLKLPKSSALTFPYKKLVYFSAPLVGIALLASLQQSIDLFFVKSLISNNNAPGYYTANQNISRVLFFALSAFSIVIFPKISRSVQEADSTQTKKLINETIRHVLILLIPGALIISATSRQLLQLIYSDTYLPGSESLSILVIGLAFLTIFTVLANVLNGAGNPSKSLLISLFSVAVTSLSCWTLIPKMGMSGAALSTTIGGFSAMIIASLVVHRTFKVLISLKSLIKILLASFTVYLLALLISVPLILLPFYYVFLFVTYLTALCILQEIKREEVKSIKFAFRKEISTFIKR